MKIAFTATNKDLSAPMDPRFGRAPMFLIYETETEAFSAIENAFADAGQGAGTRAAETVARAGVVSIVTGDCGPKAFNVLKQAGVKVYSAKAMSIAEALAAFKAGKLTEIASA